MQIAGLDELDNKILDTIRDNARLTFQQIGDAVGVSRVCVSTRMKAMEEKGIIKGYQTVIDPTALPQGIRFFMDVECTPGSYEDMVERLVGSGMIRQIYGTSGECRLHAEGYTPNVRNLDHFAKQLYRGSHSVKTLSTHLILSTLYDVDGGVDYVRYPENDHLEGKPADGSPRE